MGILIVAAIAFSLMAAAVWADYQNAKAQTYRSYLKRDWRDEPIRLTRWR